MKFLDQNGVLTLWNKIKSNFFPSTGGTITKMLNDNGDTVSVSILPTSGTPLVVDEASFHIKETFTNSSETVTAGCSLSFPLTLPVLKTYYSSQFVSISPAIIQLSDASTTVSFTPTHNQSNEYARPIQDLESILI